MSEIGISLCMVVRDEEEMLNRSLSSVTGAVCEKVVVDTGSVDRTREIARSYGAMVVSVPWRESFAEARNIAVSLASQPWILILDADEELLAQDLAGSLPWTGLRGLIRDAESRGVFGYQLRVQSYVGEGEEFVTDSVCRLFRNDPRIRFSGAIHEEVTSAILRASPTGMADAGDLALIRHYGYLDRIIAAKRKHERNRSLLEAIMRKEPEEPYWLYALGTEHFQRGEYGKALAAFEHMRRLVPSDAGYLSDYFLKRVFSLRETGRRPEATRLADEALREWPDFPDLLELRALLASDEGEEEAALAYLSDALAAGDCSKRYSSSSGAGTYRTLYWKGFVLERAGRIEEAREAYRSALLLHPAFAAAKARLAVLK
ncbi:glycosyltransferase [Cohnella boryungensis]|uniref:glycosyltransferase n=1 Tax=Cohnella boryungensis TaxID=768479 RepID=UPI00195E9616